MKLFGRLLQICLMLFQIHVILLVSIIQGNKEIKSAKDRKQSEEYNGIELYSYNFCKKEKYLHKFMDREGRSQLLWVAWYSTKAGECAVLPNICSDNSDSTLRRCCHHFANSGKWEKYNNQTILTDCSISMYCKPEKFVHHILMSNGDIEIYQNHWKETKIGTYGSLRNLCLQLNGLQLARKCYYDVDAKQARWEPVDHLKNFKCLQNIRQKTISSELNTLHNNLTTSLLHYNETERRTITKKLLSLLKWSKIKLLPADIQLVTNILKSITTEYQDTELSKAFVEIMHILMSVDQLVLRLSATTNTTNILLETFENYMDRLAEKLVSKSNCLVQPLPPVNEPHSSVSHDVTIQILNLSNIGVYAFIAHDMSVFFINPFCANISGIAIYRSYRQQQSEIRYDSFDALYYRFIYLNESINDLLREPNLELASYIPIDIWTGLMDNFDNYLLGTQLVVFKIYNNDALFVEENLLRLKKPDGRILSISLPQFKDKLPGSLPFIFCPKGVTYSSREHNSNTGCGYWNYSTWINIDVFTNSSGIGDLILCKTNHLTQFTYLLGGNYKQDDLSDKILVTALNQQALDIISLVGCSASLIGLLGIWMTALLFKNWRSQASNKVLLNLCVALTLQIVLFLFVNTSDMAETLVAGHDYAKCVLMGAVLQYSTLVVFNWLLIIAFLQFQRYVTVIGSQRPKHYILKSALLAWSLPLLPTLPVVILYPKSYIPTNYQLATNTGFCYPSGNGLYFAVILPVSLIVLVNFTIFFHVLHSISHTLTISLQRNEKQLIVKQIRLSVLLFFLLGLTWIFGIFAFIKAGIIFSYLFCLTATLQGFILFIYFVVADANARSSWMKALGISCTKKSSANQTTELQSMTKATSSFTS